MSLWVAVDDSFESDELAVGAGAELVIRQILTDVLLGPTALIGWWLATHAQTNPSGGFQGGVINDYITWLVAGVAVLGGLLALIIR
jgi:hypothetical protein